MKNFVMPLLLGATALTAMPSNAHAQDQDADVAALLEEVRALRAEVEQLRGEVETAKAGTADTKIAFKATPEMSTEDGWKFKVRGRLMYDAATVDGPDAINDPGLGFANELRRGRIGVQGEMPGGFGYKAEVEFADGAAEFTDAYLSYETGNLTVNVGQLNNFQGLEELTSSLHTSFIERAAFTDAFGFSRRAGLSAEYAAGQFLVQGGVFTDNFADLDDENNSVSLDGRIVFMPKMGDNQLHFGASAHLRDFNDSADSVRYRQRPAVHTSDTRFVNTGNITADGQNSYGLEAAGIFGPLHVAAETHWMRPTGVAGDNPTFFGAYVEGGYIFTGESRGYKGGTFDRIKPIKGFDEGGFGSLALNARWDHLDLNDAGIIGGVQNAYQVSLNWKPLDYVLFGLNYAHIVYDDAAVAAGTDTDYSVNMLGVRGQIDW